MGEQGVTWSDVEACKVGFDAGLLPMLRRQRETQGDHAAAQALADFCATVNIHLEAYQPGERLGPVELDPTLAHHVALVFQRILH